MIQWLLLTLHRQTDATELLKQVEQAYAQLDSYADTGVVQNTVGQYKAKKRFRTLFDRKLGYRFEYRSEATVSEAPDLFVVWGQKDAAKRYWSIMNDVEEGPLAELVDAADSTALNSISPLFRVLFPSEDDQVPRITHLGFPEFKPDEKVGGVLCHKINGSYGFVGATIWIDPRTSFILKMKISDSVDGETIEDLEITYKPQANPPMSAEKINFVPPNLRH